MNKEKFLEYVKMGSHMILFDESNMRIYFVDSWYSQKHTEDDFRVEVSFIDKSDNRQDGYYLTGDDLKLDVVKPEDLELIAIYGKHDEPFFRYANYNKDRLYEVVNMFDQNYHRKRVLYYLGLSGFAECCLDHLGEDYSHTSNPVEDVYYYPSDEEFWNLVKQYVDLPFDTLKRKEVDYNSYSLD